MIFLLALGGWVAIWVLFMPWIIISLFHSPSRLPKPFRRRLGLEWGGDKCTWLRVTAVSPPESVGRLPPEMPTCPRPLRKQRLPCAPSPGSREIRKDQGQGHAPGGLTGRRGCLDVCMNNYRPEEHQEVWPSTAALSSNRKQAAVHIRRFDCCMYMREKCLSL